MLKYTAWILLCSAITFISVAQDLRPAKKREKPVPVFSVHGKPVSAEEFSYLYRKNHQHKDTDYTEKNIEEYLTLFINFKLKVEEARQRGMDTTAAFVKEYNSYKEELRKPYLPDARLTDSLVQLTYQRMQSEINASHILIQLKPDALPADTLRVYTRIEEIRNKILAGDDFSGAAATYSEDPSAKINGGNLGYFTAMQMVYPFETAAYETAVGDISMPVRTRFGYHLIKVLDKRPAQGEVEVSHIMIRTGEDKDNERAKGLIFNLAEQLQAGVHWDELCKQYSEDPATRDNGGRLRPIGTGAMAAIPEFENTAFALQKPGEISDPVQTRFGWHIIRLEKKIPLQDLGTMAPVLRNRVLRDERTTLSKQALMAKLRRDYAYRENIAVKGAVMKLADSSLQKSGWRRPTFSGEKSTLFFLSDKPYTVQDFLQYVQDNHKANSQAPPRYFDQEYNNFIDASILQLNEEKILAENPNYGFLLKEYYEGILLFEIMEKEVWNKASEDSTGQRRYYEAHVADYLTGERAHLSLYSSKTPAFRTTLERLIQDGEESPVRDFVTAQKIIEETGIHKQEEMAIFQKIPWAPGVYSVENNGIYYLAWLKAILPAGPMSFEESRSAIISDYQAFLEEIWLKRLKQQYAVKVNEKGKRYVIRQLQAK